VRLGIALAVALIGCGTETPPGGDSAAVSATPRSAPSSPARSDSTSVASSKAGATPACVSEGAWQSCSIEKRLTDAGFVPIKKGAAPGGVFDTEGISYALGPAELHVDLFRSAKEREVAVSGVDTITVTRGPGQSPWSMAPTLITSNNLLAVLLSDNGRLIERVQNAITAGLPSAAH